MTRNRILSFLAVLVMLAGCNSTSNEPPEITDITAEFSQDAEIDRLRYFREINAGDTLKNRNLTGSGVRVTIMGEMVDAAHPDLQTAVQTQFNTFSQKGEVLTGEGNQSLGAEKLGLNDGHGTHIAGTIAAACDDVGI